MAIIKLQSSDGEIFPTEIEIAKYSSTIKSMLEDAGLNVEEESIVPLPAVNAAILSLVLQWATHDRHKDNVIADNNIEKNRRKRRRTENISSWEDDLMKYDQATLFGLVSAAKYLDIPGLLHIVCKTIASMITAKSPNELRAIFNIENDLDLKEGQKPTFEQTSAMMKVSVDDWEDIFEYISLKDLHSMAATCKRMQTIAYWYFKTFHSTDNVILDGGMVNNGLKKMGGFLKNISNLTVKNATMAELGSIGKFKFNSLKGIKLSHIKCSYKTTEQIKDILANIECVEIHSCQIYGDFEEILMQKCMNLRTLKIHHDTTIGLSNNWLLQKYPKLEHIELEFKANQPIVELKTFLEQNLHLKTIGIGEYLFRDSWPYFMKMKCRLETFKFAYSNNLISSLKRMQMKLLDRDFYQRLHIVSILSVEDLSEFSSLRGLEKIDVMWSPVDVNSLSGPLNVKMISIWITTMETFEIIVRSLVGVEKMVLRSSILQGIVITLQTILLTVLQNCPTLREIECGGFQEFIALPALNAEREKVPKARKVTIFVNGNVYLDAKCKFGDKLFPLVELKRSNHAWALDTRAIGNNRV